MTLDDRLTMILNGLIRITTPYAPAPSNGSVAYVMPGTTASSVIIAADLNKTSYVAGHFTEFPSGEETILVQLPFLNDEVPEHTVLYDGSCETYA